MKFICQNIYDYFIRKRNSSFDNAIISNWEELPNIKEKYFKLSYDKLTVCVGNLSFGGTGKTPLIAELINNYLPQDLSKCIIERGYKKYQKGDYFLNSENIDENSIEFAGDEALMLFEKTKIPVSISKKKYRAYFNAINKFEPECIIVDDGYQHRWILPDLNILILDEKTIKKPFYPPFGKLRESLQNSYRANIPKGSKNEIVISENQICLEFEILPGKIYSSTNSDDISKSKKYIALAGIANPNRFIQTLHDNEIQLIKSLFFSDHQVYKIKDINKIINFTKVYTSGIITTEKDFVKLRKFSNEFVKNEISLFIQPIEFKIIDENNQLKNIIEEILITKNIKAL